MNSVSFWYLTCGILFW